MKRAGLLSGAALLLVPAWAAAHDLKLPLQELQRGVTRIHRTLDYLRASPALPRPPVTPEDHRRILGAAEVELALDRRGRALQMIVARIADPGFQKLPDYVSTLLMASELLEEADDDVGAMTYARLALERGGTAEEMAEAGARWFRLARRHQRLDGRIEVYELWKSRGGAKAASDDIAAAAAYEAAFALRSYGRFGEAQTLLAKIPSGGRHGSRAAYLSGVLFVERGDLANAERWFTALMAWPIPAAYAADETQRAIETDVRELAAVSAGRLRYERGDLAGADAAYRKIAPGSPHLAEVCYERTFLDLERKRRRGALVNLQCVRELGAAGERYVDASLLGASLFAHVGRYEDSIQAYGDVKQSLARQGELLRRGIASLEDPAGFLFSAMERNSISQGKEATPGPATLFGDSWTPAVDRAYRMNRNLGEAGGVLGEMALELHQLRGLVSGEDAFPGIGVRRTHYELLLRDIQHLQGHAGDVTSALKTRHASSDKRDVKERSHQAEAELAARLVDTLGKYAKYVEGELVRLERTERDRRTNAQDSLTSILAEVEALSKEAEAIGADARVLVDQVALEALGAIVSRLEDGSMRAEVGVLDTYWLKKEHISQRIRTLGEQKDQMNDAFKVAIEELHELENSP